LVPPECAVSLRRLYQARLKSDYGDIAPASRSEADQAVAEAEKMDMVILCGGQGARMCEETEYRPKPMVEVGGRPLLWHIMRLFGHTA